VRRSEPGFLRVAGALGAVVVALAVSACTETRDTAEGKFVPAHAGRLEVATTLPAPGFWVGDRADDVDGGFEWGIARDLADAFDLELHVVDVPFPDIVDGRLHGADLALSQVSVTPQRDEHVDFSDPYFVSQPTVVARADRTLTDLATAREWTWAARRSTTEAEFVDDVIRPDHPAVRTDSEQDAIARVRRGEVDGALMDLPTALVLTKNAADVAAVARFDRDENYAVVLPNGSDNVEAVNKQLATMRSDGRLDALDDRWLQPAFATDPGSLPVIQTP
jgi:polar amino acid transport system substrate-binding protein